MHTTNTNTYHNTPARIHQKVQIADRRPFIDAVRSCDRNALVHAVSFLDFPLETCKQRVINRTDHPTRVQGMDVHVYGEAPSAAVV